MMDRIWEEEPIKMKEVVKGYVKIKTIDPQKF